MNLRSKMIFFALLTMPSLLLGAEAKELSARIGTLPTAFEIHPYQLECETVNATPISMTITLTILNAADVGSFFFVNMYSAQLSLTTYSFIAAVTKERLGGETSTTNDDATMVVLRQNYDDSIQIVFVVPDSAEADTTFSGNIKKIFTLTESQALKDLDSPEQSINPSNFDRPLVYNNEITCKWKLINPPPA